MEVSHRLILRHTLGNTSTPGHPLRLTSADSTCSLRRRQRLCTTSSTSEPLLPEALCSVLDLDSDLLFTNSTALAKHCLVRGLNSLPNEAFDREGFCPVHK